MNIITRLSVALLLMSLPIFAEIHQDLEDFVEYKTSAEIGYVNIEEREFFKTTLAPNFYLGPFFVGLDFNLYVPLDDSGEIPSNVSWINLRKLAYSYKDLHGFRWGRLRRITMGQGLLIDNFDSGSGGNTEFTPDKTGFYGYATLKKVKISGMYTAQNVQAARFETPVPGLKILNKHIYVGVTYVTDIDGVSDDTFSVYRKKQDGYAVDARYPILDETMTIYGEYAKLNDYGKGASAGLRGAFFRRVNYRAEYRILGAQFVPGYFNSSYQATSFDLETDSPTERTEGFLAALSTSLLKDYVQLGAQYEAYDEASILSAGIGLKKIGPVAGALNYSKPYNTTNDNGIAVMDFYVETGKWYDLIGQYKWTFISEDETEKSYSVGVKIRPEKFMSLWFLK